MGLSLRARLLLSFVGVVVVSIALTSFFALRVIHRTLPQVQDVAAVDLSAAREMFRQGIVHVSDAVKMGSRQTFIREHIEKGDVEGCLEPLEDMRDSQGLDILTITDLDGNVLLRVGNPRQKATAAPIVT